MDANPVFVRDVEGTYVTIKSVLANIVSDPLPAMHLATLRSVNRYNSYDEQCAMAKNIYTALENGGILVSQISSGSPAHCKMRREVMTLPSLRRGEPGQLYWTTPEEWTEILESAGFTTRFVGCMIPNVWTLEDQWNRFNAKYEQETQVPAERELLQRRRMEFLSDASAIFQQYRMQYGDAWVQLEDRGGQTVLITYQPIFVSQKCT